MSSVKKTTLFMNGRSQSIRIPAEMRLQGEKANIQKIGNILIITETQHHDPFLSLTLAQKLITEDFMLAGRELRETQERKGN